MMNEAIKNYILYLKKECNLFISLHTSKFDKCLLSDTLRIFSIHDNSYCAYVKSSTKAHKCCCMKQERVLQKCKEGDFFGICHAGVGEFIYPIINNGNTIGFISVSGYKCPKAQMYVDAVSKKYALSKKELELAYSSLKNEIPPKTYIDTLIKPLCAMFELSYCKQKEHSCGNSDFCDKIIEYIKQNHTQNITVNELCDHFSCSRSTISHKFNAYTGLSIKAYLNNLRIEDATQLLKFSDLNITEIAFSVGFHDSNYFADAFKKKVGMCPSEYRKLHKK